MIREFLRHDRKVIQKNDGQQIRKQNEVQTLIFILSLWMGSNEASYGKLTVNLKLLKTAWGNGKRGKEKRWNCKQSAMH